MAALSAANVFSATTFHELGETAKRLDAIVFDAGYNDCDIKKLATVVADDLW